MTTYQITGSAYGIWNTTSQRWATDSEGIVVVFYTLGAAVAQLKAIASQMGAHHAFIDAEVAEIGDDGRPVEPE